MASATLNIKVSPRRMLSAREASEYVGLPTKRFPGVCSVQPVAMPDGSNLYDMRDLDAWVDSLKSGAPGNDEDILGRLG
ncbi:MULTISPECIES: hypothetical protein [unclassified Rhizobium]|uniref:hypothetical protein n=1 Tax=unclassified Rhizobium TaxID=2613769 RepID=UPI000A652918|nr:MULTISPECIES: hypothetical protein [unclassified Rhizobium]